MTWDAERIKPLQDNFIVEGYFEPKGSFLCSIDAPGFPSQEVSDDMREGWDPIWKQFDMEAI